MGGRPGVLRTPIEQMRATRGPGHTVVFKFFADTSTTSCVQKSPKQSNSGFAAPRDSASDIFCRASPLKRTGIVRFVRRKFSRNTHRGTVTD
jgi:hypothetical protein